MLAIRFFFDYVACGLLAKIVKESFVCVGMVHVHALLFQNAKQKVYAAM